MRFTPPLSKLVSGSLAGLKPGEQALKASASTPSNSLQVSTEGGPQASALLLAKKPLAVPRTQGRIQHTAADNVLQPRASGRTITTDSKQPPSVFALSQKDPLRPQLQPQFQPYFESHKLAVTSQTLPAFEDHHQTRPPERLRPASGAGWVYTVYLKGPNGDEGKLAFKPLAPTIPDRLAEHHGIPADNPQLAMRGLAASEYAKLLGFDVIPPTKIGLLTIPDRAFGKPAQPELGLVMEMGPGGSAKSTSASTLYRPDMAREWHKLQLLDHLTATSGRTGFHVHGGDAGRASVRGIDNDFSFNEKVHKLDSGEIDFTRHGPGSDRFRLPGFIEAETASAIMKITPKQLQETLGHMLTADAVTAAIQRLEGVQAHISQLERTHQVFDGLAWDLVHAESMAGTDISSYLHYEYAGALLALIPDTDT